MQSIGLCPPFQCYSGCAEKKANPLALSMRLQRTLGFSSKLIPHFHSKNRTNTNNDIHTTLIALGLKGKHHKDQIGYGNWRTQLRLWQTISRVVYALLWPKRLIASQNSWLCPPLAVQSQEHEIPNRQRRGNHTKTSRNDPNHWTLTKTLPSHAKKLGKQQKRPCWVHIAPTDMRKTKSVFPAWVKWRKQPQCEGNHTPRPNHEGKNKTWLPAENLPVYMSVEWGSLLHVRELNAIPLFGHAWGQVLAALPELMAAHAYVPQGQ